MNHDHIEAHDVSSRYVAGKLTDDEERDFEAHLVDCQPCIDAVESEMSLRDGLRLVGADRAPQPSVPPASAAAPAYLFLKIAAAVLLAASIGLGAWLSRSTAELAVARGERDTQQHRARQAEQSAKALEQRLADAATPAKDARPAPREEQVLPAVVFALTTVRGASSADSAPVNRFRIDGNARLAVFSLEVPPATGSGEYVVSLKDRAARVLWSGGPFPPSSSDSLAVAIDRALLPDGDYILELSRRSPAGRLTPIGHYTFRIAAR
jgi:Putative zinc-finger